MMALGHQVDEEGEKKEIRGLSEKQQQNWS